MLTCIYHPIDSFRVVESDEADKLKATGVWFDSPLKARQYKEKVEDDIKQEEMKEKKPKSGRKSNERR